MRYSRKCSLHEAVFLLRPFSKTGRLGDASWMRPSASPAFIRSMKSRMIEWARAGRARVTGLQSRSMTTYSSDSGVNVAHLQLVSQAGAQDAHRERLFDVVVGAQVVAPDDVFLAALARDHDDRDMAIGRQLSESFQNLPSAEAREIDVQ